MVTPLETVQRFMAVFIDVWPTGDATKLKTFFSDDAVYHNGPLPPIVGSSAIQKAFTEMMTVGGQIAVDLVNVVADGPIVMTERVDHVTESKRDVSLEVMGIFEVHDGLITAWRDYFDASQFTSQING